MMWRLVVVDRDGSHVGELDLVAGSMTLGARLTATIGARGVELLPGRFVAGVRDGVLSELWVPIDPLERTMTEAGETWSLTCLPLTRLVERVSLRRGMTVPAGAFVRETVTAAIRDALPWLPVTIGDTDGSVREPLAWSAGAALSEPVAALLAAGGMTPLAAVPGEVRLESHPWEPPSQRPVVARFAADSQPTSTPFLPAVSVGGTIEPAPNEYLAITRSTPPLVGRWADEASIAANGPITRVESSVDATSQTAADRIAAQHREADRPRRRMRMTGRYDARAAPGAVVEVDWPLWQVTGRWEVASASVSLGLAADADYELMEV